VTDSATFTTSENEDEDLGEDLGGLDDLLVSVRSEDAPKPKRGRGRAKKEAPAKDFKAVLWASADKLRAQMDAAEYKRIGILHQSEPLLLQGFSQILMRYTIDTDPVPAY
jgi:type I restriction enzyme M protein